MRILSIMNRTKTIGTGVLLVGLAFTPAALAQSQPRQGSDEDKQALRDLIRRNLPKILETERKMANGEGTVFTDGEGNEYTLEQARARMFARDMAEQEGRLENFNEVQQGKASRLEGPMISFLGEETHDFGIVPEKAELVHRFTFKNTGTTTLVIEKINTGCGCTVAKLPKYEYEPGESGHIDLTYKPKGVGTQSRSVQVLTNDARGRVKTVLLKAEVIPVVATRPNVVQFGQVTIGETREAVLEIVSRDAKFQITGVNVNGKEFDLELIEDAQPSPGKADLKLPGYAQVKVKLLGNADVGRLLRVITIDTLASEGEGKPQQSRPLRINCFANISGNVAATPPFMRIKPLKAQEEFSAETFVSHQKGDTFEIIDAKVVNAALPVTVTYEPAERAGKSGYMVKINGTAGRTSQSFRGTVVLTTNLERERILEVQFSGLVRAR